MVTYIVLLVTYFIHERSRRPALSACRTVRAVARVLTRREFGQARHELAVGNLGCRAALDVDGD